MSSIKLAPIYAALDNHQYNRAIKLCHALPSTYVIGQALLAHAYAKSSQRHKALITIQNILGGGEGFPELQLEIKYAFERRQDFVEQTTGAAAATQQAQQQTPTVVAGKKSNVNNSAVGKKGKKKTAAQTSKATPAPTNVVTQEIPVDQFKDFDWIDQLDSPPTIPENWEEALPSQPPPSDPTLLATLSTTLSFLRLYLTAYQMYTWVISFHSNDLECVKQTYLLGLSVWMAPQSHYLPIKTKLLAQLQVTALQVARLQHERIGSSRATAWAAQTALWQMHNEEPPAALDETKRAMLPRLAESLASKACNSSSSNNNNNNNNITSNKAFIMMEEENNQLFLIETENFLLYLRTLDIQQKWEQKLTAIQARMESAVFSNPREEFLREEKAKVLISLGRLEEAREELKHLLRLHPDHWEYWKLHLENDDSAEMAESLAFVKEILEQSPDQTYPLRGPQLARIERQLILLQKNDAADLTNLIQEVINYGNMLARRASCTSNDLSVYIQYICEKGTLLNVSALKNWIQTDFVASGPSSSDAGERLKQLCGFIFGIKVLYEIASHRKDMSDLPHWKEILLVWYDFKAFEDFDQAQKENRAGDDLILLAVQQLTRTTDGGASSRYQDLVLAACILEAAIDYSPHNSYLKIAALFVYSDLCAVQRSYDLFRQCYIKHIQYESCAYLILDVLRAGGFYQEALSVCQEILRFQTSSTRDAAEYTGRAMESGTLVKASEIIKFQRERINRSLTTLQAKGLILDCAPMFLFGVAQDLGAAHGIVGGPEDKDRVCQMIAEAHNPHGAFSLLRLRENAGQEHLNFFTENRDFDILSQVSILDPRQVATRQQILSESTRRCYHHSLLIRASLCLDATKGPKKGKVTKSSPELSKRCSSLLSCIRDAAEFTKKDVHQTVMTKSALDVMLYLCRTIVVVSGGLTDDGANILDSVESREEGAAVFLTSAVTAMKECHGAFTNLKERTNPIPIVGNFLPDCLVAIFALVKMCGGTLEIYGWGKRKRGTRKSAAALADLSGEVKNMIVDMKGSLDAPFPMSQDSFFSSVDGILDRDHIEKTKLSITNAQLETKVRIEQIFSKMVETLDSFDVDLQ